MVISIKNLSYSFPTNHLVFKDISLDIKEGEFWGLLGRNGAGKTTLIDLILGIKFPNIGEISILGKNPNNKIGNHLDDVVFLSQDIALQGDSTVEEFLNFHSKFYAKYSKKIESEMLNYFKLNRDAKIGALSTGQQKKAQIIAGFASDTKIIIIDEVTAVLDPETRHHFFLKLQEFNKKYRKTILLATNIAEDLTRCADKIFYINNYHGEIVEPQKINSLFNLQE